MTKPLPTWAVVADSETKLKEEFAELLLRRPNEAFECAKIVTGGDPDEMFALSFVRSRSWPNDPYVKDAQKKLREQFGLDHFLPSRYEMFHELWKRVKVMDDGDFIRGMELAMTSQGFVGKSGPTGGQNDPIHTVTRIELVAPSIEKQMKVIEHEGAA